MIKSTISLIKVPLQPFCQQIALSLSNSCFQKEYIIVKTKLLNNSGKEFRKANFVNDICFVITLFNLPAHQKHTHQLTSEPDR